MSKDPAFLFYSSDFLTGVADLSMEERGIYITLLCLQHQKGRLTPKMIQLCGGNATADVLAKFSKDEEGNFYNERLEVEIQKRKEHTEKQRQRAKDGWIKRKDNQSHGIATALPLENENENEDEIVIKDKNKEKEKIKKLWLENQFELFWGMYDKKVDKDKAKPKFMALKQSDIERIFQTLPDYVKSTPDPKYRKNPATYLNNKSWNNEIIAKSESEQIGDFGRQELFEFIGNK